jgi:SAM-dependent methyltransferase
MNLEARYTSGEHLEKTPNWHAHESPWKAEYIVQMLDKHGLQPQRVCEVGCGAGEVLRLLQKRMPSGCSFWGYDISPQAIALCAGKGNEQLHFELKDVRKDQQTSFDLILVLDVIEHLEDYFSFLRDIKPKSRYALMHIPLEISVQSVFIGKTFIWTRGQHGHLHYFSKETALRTVQDVGYEVLDYSYSPEFELPAGGLAENFAKIPRKLFFALHHDWAARVLGGTRLLVLVRNNDFAVEKTGWHGACSSDL